MASFLIALQILTIFPVPSPKKMELRYIGEGTRYFTLIGLFLGLILAGTAWLALIWLPKITVMAGLTCLLAILAGGSHLDGLMDTADGLGSRREKEKMLEIMKDSRVGAYGVMAACGVFLLKFSLLLSLPAIWQYYLLVLMPAWGRWAISFGACLFPYARPDGLGKPFAQYSGWKEFIIATVIIVIASFSLLSFSALWLILAVMVTVFLLNILIVDRLGGLTGDTYGATCEVAEIVFLTAAVAILN